MGSDRFTETVYKDHRCGHTPSSSMRVGILGGTFDPVHKGHILLAEAARDKFLLDVVYFMPTDDPYYKAKSNVSPFKDRLRMTELALEGHPALVASDFENVNDTDGYTINTLTAFKEQHPEAELFFIIGGDSLFSMEKWKDVDQIFQMTRILVNKRKDEAKGASGSLAVEHAVSSTEDADLNAELEAQICYLKEKYHAEIFNLHAPQFDISSSELRSMIRNGEDVRAYLPASVIDYISEHNLYS